MSRIKEAFAHGKAIITFLPAGDPSPDKTREYLTELARAGADVIGVVLPVFECPDETFRICRSFRGKEKTALVLMTAVTSATCYGEEEFFEECSSAGIDGVILTGTSGEQEEEMCRLAKKNGVSWIPALPAAAEGDISAAAARAEGFLYLISGSSEDGKRQEDGELAEVLQEIRRVTDVPVVIGFGIHTTDQATEAARMSDGIAVGSVFVNMIAQYGGHAAPHIYTYARMMREAVLASER